MRGFWFQEKTVQLKTALREVYTYVLNGFFFSKNRVSARLLVKISVSQGYCYVIQCTLYYIFAIEEKDKKEMPQLYIIPYTLFQLQTYHLTLIPLAVRVSCMSGLSHKH